jgi:hypothetical protein
VLVDLEVQVEINKTNYATLGIEMQTLW